MSLLNSAKYLWLALTHPQRADFAHEGIGIEARANRCADGWRQHLRLSQEFQRRALGELSKSRVMVLGAGRLFDVPLDCYSQGCSELYFVDADPGVTTAWKLAQRSLKSTVKMTPLITDVTGRIDLWTELLKEQLRSNTAPEQALRNLVAVAACHEVDLPPCDVVVSLNLLSQIPLYWRERAVKLLKRRVNIFWDEEDRGPPAIEQALEQTMALLQREHLELLTKSGASKVLLLTDRYFHYYRSDTARWRTESAWCDFDTITLNGYTPTLTDQWLWHIAPQGIEFKDYGVIHDVRAMAFHSTMRTNGEKHG